MFGFDVALLLWVWDCCLVRLVVGLVVVGFAIDFMLVGLCWF